MNTKRAGNTTFTQGLLERDYSHFSKHKQSLSVLQEQNQKQPLKKKKTELKKKTPFCIAELD